MDVMGDIGTLEWTRRTRGILGRGERARYIAAVTLAQGRNLPGLIGLRAGLRARRRVAIDESDLAPPDSKPCREAVEVCAEALPRTIIEHSYRSFIYARALASLESRAHDEEVLFVATMFHDLGIARIDREDGGRCFTLAGAEGAEAHLRERGAPPERARTAAEAVTLHINPAVGPEHGPEPHLMHDGVLLDVVGARAWQLQPGARERVRERHPWLDFVGVAGGMLREQADAIPGCRVAAAFQAGFGLALRLGV